MTHQIELESRIEQCRAWQHRKEAPRPIWVVRKFHYIGDGKLTCLTAGGTATLDPGEWAMQFRTGETIIVTDAEFTEHFRPIPNERA